EDRALQRGGGDDPAPAAVLVSGVRRRVLSGESPEPLEDHARDRPGGHAEQDPHRLVRDLGGVHSDRLPTTISVTAPPKAAAAPASSTHGAGESFARADTFR